MSAKILFLVNLMIKLNWWVLCSTVSKHGKSYSEEKMTLVSNIDTAVRYKHPQRCQPLSGENMDHIMCCTLKQENAFVFEPAYTVCGPKANG